LTVNLYWINIHKANMLPKMANPQQLRARRKLLSAIKGPGT